MYVTSLGDSKIFMDVAREFAQYISIAIYISFMSGERTSIMYEVHNSTYENVI